MNGLANLYQAQENLDNAIAAHKHAEHVTEVAWCIQASMSQLAKALYAIRQEAELSPVDLGMFLNDLADALRVAL